MVQDGIKCKYLCYKGEEGVEHDLLLEEKTDEKNGVLFEMSIKDYYEYRDFTHKAKEKLTYYDTVVLIIDDKVVENKIFRNDLFQFAEVSPYNNMHLCLKDVVYEINFNKLGINDIYMPIALRFNLDDGLVPTPSRESLLYSNSTIELIKKRIAEVSDYMVSKYNEQANKFDNILDAWDYIGVQQKMIKLEEQHFDCQSLGQFSKYSFKLPEVEGIVLKDPYFYKRLKYELLGEYTVVAYDRRGSWKKKYINNEFANSIKDNYTKVIQYNGNLAGRVKTFLRGEYDSAIYINKDKPYSLKQYRSILLLGKDTKHQWRDLIKEFQLVRDQIVSRKVIDKSNVESTQEYIDWLSQMKECAREKRKETVSSGNYKGLNKQQGEITIRQVVKPNRVSEKCSFKVYTKEISNLNLNSLCVYFEKDVYTKETLLSLVVHFPKVKFIQLNTTEKKHVQNIKSWVTMTEFKNTKAFSRLATALEIKNLEKLAPNNEEVIYETFPKYAELKQELADYLGKNMPDDEDYEVGECVENIIEDFAKENNTYDTNIWSKVVEFKKLMKDFSFLNYLDIDNFDNLGDDEQKIIKNMVYIILKNKKISCRFVEDYELVEKVPDVVYEQLELEIA